MLQSLDHKQHDNTANNEQYPTDAARKNTNKHEYHLGERCSIGKPQKLANKNT